MRYEDEAWIKVYTRDTPGWLSLSWQARGLSLDIARKLPKNTGELSLGRKGLPALAVLLRADWSEIEPFIAELIDDGRLVYDPVTNAVTDPQHPARQSTATSNAERQRQWRERQALKKPAENEETVTRRNACVTTNNHKKEEKEEKRSDQRDPPIKPPVADEGRQADAFAPPAEPSAPVTGVRPREVLRASETIPPPPPPKSTRGSRLPVGWTPSADTIAWARKNGFPDPLAILDEFRDYWASVPGARGCKVDWDATYRVRMRQVGGGRQSGRMLRGAEITKQPTDPDAPWMTLPEVGT